MKDNKNRNFGDYDFRNFENLNFQIYLKKKMTDILSNINITQDKIEELKNYRVCKDKISKECIGIGDRKHFKHKTCTPCFNFKCLVKTREKEGKLIWTENNLDQEQIIELFKSFTSPQLIKISGLLTLEQQLLIKAKNKCDSDTSGNNSISNLKSEIHNDPKENSDKDSDNSLNSSPNSSPKLKSLPNPLESSRKPTLKIKISTY